MLRQYLPHYDKRIDFAEVASGVAEATARAHRLETDAQETGEPGRNPTTGFYRLTSSIARKGPL